VVPQPPAGPRRPLPAAVEIVVPARNEEHRLPEGLRALCARAAMLPLRTAVLVVDSASTDRTADVVRNWPAGPVPVRLIGCDRPGKGRAVQTGLLATQAPFVGFCDADMATGLAAASAASNRNNAKPPGSETTEMINCGWPADGTVRELKR